MSLAPDAVSAIGLPMALGLGMLYGLGPCLVSCLPYLGPVFLNADQGVRHSWKILLPLALGRLTVYAGFGAISGWWGSRFVAGVDGWVVHLAIGLALLLVGVSLLSRRCRGTSCGARPMAGEAVIRWSSRQAPGAGQMMPFGLFLMGVGMALTPCVPLSTVLISSAATGSSGLGALLGLSFGLGAITAPSLIYGVVVAYFGQQLRVQLGTWLPRLEVFSAALLVVVGITQLLRLF